MRVYKTIPLPPTVVYFLLDCPLRVLSLCPHSFHYSCLAPFNSTVFPTSLPWHWNYIATDIQMMMPWISCLNAIIPPHCSLLTSPPPLMLRRWRGLFAGNSSTQSYLLTSQVSQWHSRRIFIIWTFKFAFLLLFLEPSPLPSSHVSLSYIHLTSPCNDEVVRG